MERLRQIREQTGYSQQELADASGVSQHTISEIELGRRKPQGRTLRKLASVLAVKVADFYGEAEYPKEEAPPDLQQSFNGLLEEDRRAQDLYAWTNYLARRVEWCEKVLQKPREDDWNNSFLSLDTAIQWAIYVGIESTQLRNTIQAEVLPNVNGDSEVGDTLRTLLARFKAVVEQTDAKVKTMMEEAGLTEEDQERRLRLIFEGAA